MTPIEIVLIILGCIIIIISFRLVGGSKKDQMIMDSNQPIELSEKEQKEIKKKIDELVNEVCEDAIVKADDYLSKISNEKILAVNEFSDQIIEKINSNHQEVVFLYHMLNNKEEELKKTVAEINTAKRKIQEIIQVAKKGTKGKNLEQIADQKKHEKQEDKLESTDHIQDEEFETLLENEANDIENTAVSSSTENVTYDEDSLNENHNHKEEILELYKDGYSVVEIAKTLELGQGEVKLVIDLFQK